MEVLYSPCAKLDVHAANVVACVRIALGGSVTYEHRTVATTTRGLLDLTNWLTAHGVTHVAMEATGLTPFRAAVSLLTTMPGVSETAAAVIIAEIGDDMSTFPSAGHLSRGPGCTRDWMKATVNADRCARARAHHG